MRLESTRGEKISSEPSLKLPADQAKLLETTIALSSIELPLYGLTCVECDRMSAVPQGAFAVCQIRKRGLGNCYAAKGQEDEEQDNKSTGFGPKVLQEGREPTPLKYNSKLMNSIWGLYNRYSVHNFKKIDANEAALLAEAWGALRTERPSVAEGPVVIGASH